MIRLVDLDELDRDAYLAGLNICFPGWGGTEMFDWAFNRLCAGQRADMLQVEQDGRLIAGSAVTYRHIRFSDGSIARAGIMTGAWTSPESRGKGIFTRIVAASRGVALDRGAALLLGFGRVENASYRRIAAAGSAFFPTHQLLSTSSVQNSGRPVLIEVVDPTPRLFDPDPHISGFVYSDREWIQQFIERPHAVKCLSIGEGRTHALIESRDDLDRVIALRASDESDWTEDILTLARRAHKRAKSLFCFTSVATRAHVLAACGFDSVAGFLSSLPPSDVRDWDFQNGDRM